MDRKEKAEKLANSILLDWDNDINQVTAALLKLKSHDYDLLYEGVEKGWISKRFVINNGLWMDNIPVYLEDKN